MKRTLAFFTLVFTAANLFGVDTIHFSQSSVDRLVIDPDIGPEVRTTETGSFNASITVPGLSLSAVTDDTLLEVAIGNFQFSNVVGEGDDPSPNCVRFTNEIGRITFCISGNVITITGSGQSELEPFFVDPLFEEEGNRASGTLDASITIGDYSIQRVVHYQFTRTVTQRVVDMEPYELETVTGAGDTDNQRPTITLTSPRAGQRFTENLVEVSGRAGDNFGVREIQLRINDGEPKSVSPLDGTNTWSSVVTLQPGTNVIRANSVDLGGLVSTQAVVKVFYVFPLALSVDYPERGTVGTLTNGQLLIPGASYMVKATAKPGYLFSGWSGGDDRTNLAISFVMEPDYTLVAHFIPNPRIPPTIALLTPRPGSLISESSVVVTARATDNDNVEGVALTLNGRELPGAEPVEGTNLWTAEVTLDPGTNVIRAVSRDGDGNSSTTAVVRVIHVYPLGLTFDPGFGKVMGVSNGQYLIPGVRYQATAQPKTNAIFIGWAGDVATNAAMVSFIMQPDRTLSAGFIANPWIPAKGTYTGLFCAETDADATNSGALNLTLTERGTFTGTLRHSGTNRPFSGAFPWSNQTARVLVARGGRPALVMGLLLDPQIGQVTGGLEDTNWNASSRLERVATFPGTNTTALAGRYTFAIPGGGADSTNRPGGDGVGTLVISAKGAVSLGGTLGDGLSFTQSTVITASKEFPLYIPLYGGRGMLAGWVTFPVSGEEPSEIDVLDQDGLKWIKPVRPLDKFYPQGFTVTPGLFGARYTPPLRGTNALNWTNGLAALLGGNVPESLAPLVIPVWLSNNVVRVSGTNTNNFSLTFTSANGLFSGLFKHPATGRPAAFKGAVIQARPSHLGAGWFLGTNQSGSISLLAPPPDM